MDQRSISGSRPHPLPEPSIQDHQGLTDLDLIEETEDRRGNVKSVHTILTLKGRQVAQLAQKMKQVLT